MPHEENKIYDEESLEEWEQEVIRSMEARLKNKEPVNEAFGGPLNTKVPEKEWHYVPARNEYIIQNNNAYITFGSDRPSGVLSGWGGKGAQRANRIDIVVGRMASKPKALRLINNCFSADAARIYLSQATNIDDNFGIVHGATPPVPVGPGGLLGEISAYAGLSGIGIKADTVRIIGREGIKIVTGKMKWPGGFGMKGETNSRKGKISRSSPPIELIAGNDDGDDLGYRISKLGAKEKEYMPRLQGVAQGERTADTLLELGGILDDLWAIVYTFITSQLWFNAIVQLCTSAAATNMPLTNGPLWGIGIQYWRPGGTLHKQLGKCVGPMWHLRSKKTFWEINHLKPYGYKYLCSRNVFTT